MDDREFCAVLSIEQAVCEAWVERQWLVPAAGSGGRRHFRQVDVARGRLLLDLERSMGVNEEGIDIIVHLVDQFYGLRLTFGDLVSAINAQPEPVRRRILGHAEVHEDRRPVALTGSAPIGTGRLNVEHRPARRGRRPGKPGSGTGCPRRAPAA